MTNPLLYNTSREWTDRVLADFDSFLLDHAAAEKKASGMAMSMLSHYPDRLELVSAMADLAVEELTHFREVLKWVHQRGLQTGPDQKDPYVIEFRKSIRRGREEFLLDRLLVAAAIEARGAERFGLIAAALDKGPLKLFYNSITRSERRHYQLFIDLAKIYLPAQTVNQRWQELREIEAAIVARLPIRAALH